MKTVRQRTTTKDFQIKMIIYKCSVTWDWMTVWIKCINFCLHIHFPSTRIGSRIETEKSKLKSLRTIKQNEMEKKCINLMNILSILISTFNAFKSISSSEQFTEGAIWCAILTYYGIQTVCVYIYLYISLSLYECIERWIYVDQQRRLQKEKSHTLVENTLNFRIFIFCFADFFLLTLNH